MVTTLTRPSGARHAAVDGATIPRIRQLISVHVYVGALLVGPVLLKSASTLYRFIRYYAGARSYRQKGPSRTGNV